jgi:hypothetical protein
MLLKAVWTTSPNTSENLRIFAHATTRRTN